MRCAVLGDPIAHSLSPVLHRAAYEALGLDWTYDAVQVPSGRLGAFLEELDGSWRGLSLTMPLKREAVPLLTSSDEWVHATGAANTVVLDGVGTRHGLNTDVPGARDALRWHVDRPLTRAVVFGAGATAVSVLFALAELGLERAVLLARDPSRAGETVRVLAQHLPDRSFEVRSLVEAAAHLVAADILVSTVPASAQVPELVASTMDTPVVFEAVYNPWPTPLASATTGTGRTLVSGLDLLLGQASYQIRAMTGSDEVPLDAMRAAAEKELEARGGR